MSAGNIRITAAPVTDAMCSFTVEQPVYPDKAFYFGSKESAEGSPLAERLFAITGVSSVQVSHDKVIVKKISSEEWQDIGKQVGAALRDFLGSGDSPVSDAISSRVIDAEDLKRRVQAVIDNEINPSVAGHGGQIRLIDVKDNVVFIQMGGGCQGCGQADVTLKYGIEMAIRAEIEEVGEILDVTDHASGRNPYYTPSKK